MVCHGSCHGRSWDMSWCVMGHVMGGHGRVFGLNVMGGHGMSWEVMDMQHFNTVLVGTTVVQHRCNGATRYHILPEYMGSFVLFSAGIPQHVTICRDISWHIAACRDTSWNMPWHIMGFRGTPWVPMACPTACRDKPCRGTCRGTRNGNP